MLSVLRSSASEAHKVEALRDAGIQFAKKLVLGSECFGWCMRVHIWRRLLTCCGVFVYGEAQCRY